MLILFTLLGLLVATPAYANVVWPALYFEQRMLAPWVIALGLLIEFLVLVRIFRLSYKRALAADLVMNAVSTIVGILLLPLSGILFELLPGAVLYTVFDIGTFNPFTWTMTFALAFVISTLLEALILWRVFKITLKRREFYWLLLANMLSALCVFVSFLLVPQTSI